MVYWQQMIRSLENDHHDYKLHSLPLARIKKVMKADPEVKMISAEAPILFAKTCDIFITELTMRAWIHAEENKRRTLQRSDIAAALSKSDMFDFLIDIVPREEAVGHGKRHSGQVTSSSGQINHVVSGAQAQQASQYTLHGQTSHQVAQYHTMSQPAMPNSVEMSQGRVENATDFNSSAMHTHSQDQDPYRGSAATIFGSPNPMSTTIPYDGQPHQMYQMDAIYGFAPLPSQQQVCHIYSLLLFRIVCLSHRNRCIRSLNEIQSVIRILTPTLPISARISVDQ